MTHRQARKLPQINFSGNDENSNILHVDMDAFYASVEAELSNIPSQGSCFDYVPEMAAKYGVDADSMTRIIKAESGGNPLSKNKNSTASGCGQFIRGTWAGTLRQMGREWVTPFDAQANVEAMAFKISRGGIGAWNASKSKWSK